MGYKGAIDGAYAVAIKPKYTFGTNHYYKNDWLNSYLSYTYNTKENFRNGNVDVVFGTENGDVSAI